MPTRDIMAWMNESRRKHTLNKTILVNDTLICEIIIDPHVDKHKDHIIDDLIISLVELLDGRTYSPTNIQDEFSYFVSKVLYSNKVYRLVWLQQKNQFYIGVVTAFKEKGAKHDIP
jgi:hypothetical protein